MQITFYGAAREVTGSMHLVTHADDRVLLDCGLFQGRRSDAAEKNRVLPFDAGILTNLVLSHAHTDHSGRIPLLTRNGFGGRVFCTRPTRSACTYLLPDSASIQQSDADYLNYKTVRRALTRDATAREAGMSPAEAKALLKRGRHELNTGAIGDLLATLQLQTVSPLYTLKDAEAALAAFEGYPYGRTVEVGSGLSCTFYDAGHILGSAISMISQHGNGRPARLCFTGDLGRFDKPILNDPQLEFPEHERDVDLLVLESTYGDRLHEPVADLKGALQAVLEQALRRGGTVLIPAFAFGRTQVLLYLLHELTNEHRVPRVPIYVDSPLAVNLTQVFAEHPEVYDRDTQAAFLSKGQNPFYFEGIHFVRSVEESMALYRDDTPKIIIAASGMCEAGRILHHLRFKIHDERNTVLLVGYMAENTLGRRIEEEGLAYAAAGRKGPAPLLRFYNKEYPLRANVVKIDGFSGHADKAEMLRFLKQSNLRVRRIALVHGEEVQSLHFADALRREGYEVSVPRRGESMQVG